MALNTYRVEGLMHVKSVNVQCPPFGVVGGRGSQVVKVLDHGCYVTSSSPVPLKTRLVGKRCMLNLSRDQTSSRWCGAVFRRGGDSSGVVLGTWSQLKITSYVAKSPPVAEKRDINIHLLIWRGGLVRKRDASSGVVLIA
ncbi:uncharacterized protein TNCV_1426181 [Trichonephila clavipes]|nr:uncharacterized protein TNCV_1426181 [Trichonephila clavipes]